MNRMMIFIVLGLLLAGCAGQPTTSITHVYAFGDDHSDNGKCAKFIEEEVSKGQLEEEFLNVIKGNWKGRMTNGPVAVEVLADRLNVPLTDYAVCAAKSDEWNLFSGLSAFENAGLLGQIGKFEADLNGEQADPEALYVIEIGGTDFFESRFSGSADGVLENIAIAVSRLAALGANHILVGNAFNFSEFPGFSPDAGQAEQFESTINANLPGKMQKLAQELKTEIEIFDFSAIEDNIQNDPEKYGFKDLVYPCTQLGLEFQTTEPCENPDEYYYYGMFYLTGHVHEILGEAMAAQVSK